MVATSFKERKFSIGVLWNIASLGILALGGVFVNLLIVKVQGEASLGLFNQVYALYIVLSQVGVGGLQFSTLKQVSYHQGDRATCADITTAALLLVTAITIPLCLVIFALSGAVGDLLQSPDVAYGLRLVLPGLLFFALNKVLINVVNGLDHMRAYAVFRSFRLIFLFVGLGVLIATGQPAPVLPLALTLGELFLFVGLFAYVYGRLLPRRNPLAARPWFPEHIGFGLRGVFSGILTEMNTRVDVLVLGYFTSDSVVGLYSFAAILAEGFAQLPQTVRWSLDPQLGALFSSGQQAEIEPMARKIRRVFFPAMIGLGVVAVLVYPVFYALVGSGGDRDASWAVFAILAAGIVLSAGYLPFSGLLLQGNRPAMHTVFVLGSVLCNLVLNLLFVPVWGVYGSAAGTAITFVVQAVALVWLGRRLFGVRL